MVPASQGSDPVTWVVAGASSTSWLWLPTLAEVNAVLTSILTIMGIGLTGYKIYNEWKKSQSK
jgi:uncharacterized membrane protein YebE (DUF533 family)